MKFILEESYCQAHIDLENQEPEPEMKLNPKSSTAQEFKTFTCAFVFSSLQHMQTMKELLKEAQEGNRSRDVKIGKLEKDVADLKTGLEHRDEEIGDLRSQIRELTETLTKNKRDAEKQCTDLNRNLSVKIRDTCNPALKASIENERHSRSFNLRAFNLAEAPNEKTEQTIKLIDETIKKITGLDIKIEYGHRTGQKREQDPRGVIFRFASRQDRWKVYSKRGDFFRANIPLYEDLPKVDLVEKQKHAEKIKQLYTAKHKVAFIRGKWWVDGEVYNG